MRRTALRFVYEKFEGTVAGDKGFMTYQQACSIFGFQMNDKLEKREIKNRFNKLVLKFHPDHGGTSEQFQILREAHKILLAHRHDKGNDSKDKGTEIKFRRVHYDDMTNTIHRQSVDKQEYRSFSVQDFAFFITFIVFIMCFYFYRAWQTQMQVLRSRWSYTEDRMNNESNNNNNNNNNSVKAWHPWRSDQEIRDTMDEIGIIQGSIKRELVEEKRRLAPTVYTPWQSGGPFAIGHRVDSQKVVAENNSEGG